jgi:hypothetical protein
MKNWQATAEHLIQRFKPESDSSLFHYDGDLGAVLINFVEGITEGSLRITRPPRFSGALRRSLVYFACCRPWSAG